MADTPPPTPDQPTPANTEIGVDRWVSEADERRDSGGLGGRIQRLWGGLPPSGKLALLTPAIFLPFLPLSEATIYTSGLFILIYALLALGLNVVVGFAGLLDLGYVAFFGFGAYAYAFLSGTHHEKGHVYTHHWSGQYSILTAVVLCAVVGLFPASSSRRLLGDYVALVWPFFRQGSVVFTNSAAPYGITNGSNGLGNIDPLHFSAFGVHLTVSSTRGYYWFLFGCVVLVLIIVHLLSESRTGRAWKASREDPLAAELMGMPVNRLKIMAFSFGAAIAGLAGSVFAAAQTGAFPQNFGTQVLILIYAVVILGGAGSLTGMLAGAIAIIASNQVLDSTSPPNIARVLFYAALIATIFFTMRSSWPRIVAAFVGTAAFGFAVHAIVDEVWARGTAGQVTSGGFLSGVIRHWVLLPADPGRLA